jgi:hypothetical protein
MERRDLIISIAATTVTATLLAVAEAQTARAPPANSSGVSSEVSVGSAGRAGAPGRPTIVIEHHRALGRGDPDEFSLCRPAGR